MVYNVSIVGQPCSDINEETHPDWAPTIFPKVSQSHKNISRYHRAKKRDAVKAASQIIKLNNESSVEVCIQLY